MGVYVDRLPLESVLGKWAGGAHMYGSSLEELNSMADKIGVSRERFEITKEVIQYRLTSEERSLAIERGATEIMLGDIPSDALTRQSEEVETLFQELGIPLRARIAELANAIEQISRALARVATETEDPLRGRASLLFDNVDTLKMWCMMEEKLRTRRMLRNDQS